MPVYHAGEDFNFRHISCEDLEAASLTIMESARVRRQEQNNSVPVPQLQAAKVLAQAGQLAFAPATVRSDTSRPVAVGSAGEQLHNRLQVSSKTSHTKPGESCIAIFSRFIKLRQPLHQTANRGSCCCTCRADHSQPQCTSAKAGMPCKMVAHSSQVKQAGLAIPTVQFMSGQIAQ